MNSDKVLGMFAAFALGDALGAPHEFKQNACNIYTGKLEMQAFRFNRFTKETRHFKIGCTTDDTEATLALLQTIENGEYSVERALQAYLKWANSGCPHLGKNTRALFHGIKTVRGYKNRMTKVLATGEVSQSNGSLMRCSPLALVKDWQTAAVEDCDLSNPNPINRACSLIYLSWLTQLLAGEEVTKDYTQLEIEEDILETIETVLKEENRNVDGPSKGWVLHALWCAQLALTATSFTQLMKEIISKKGDTDTNAAIAGAVYGAKFGFTELMKEQQTNWDILNGRPEYDPKQLEAILPKQDRSEEW